MTKLVAPLVVLAGLAGTAAAQTADPRPAGAAPAAAPSDPAPAAPPATPAAAPGASDARKQCAAAMNADPQFAAEIVKVADEKAAERFKAADAATVSAHVEANAHVQKNERHVIYAYVAMWLVAAAFVLFLWRRQQALNAEIAQLRRDLEAASDETKRTEQRR